MQLTNNIITGIVLKCIRIKKILLGRMVYTLVFQTIHCSAFLRLYSHRNDDMQS